jgi:hypothetical protein
LMGIICTFYILLYFLTYQKSIINIDNLSIVKTISISVLTMGFLISLFFMEKKIPVLLVIYSVCAIALILFLITTIFILKVQGLFFWEADRIKQAEFFKFSFFLSGWIYILAIPSLIVLIVESSVLFNSNRI